ncbi:putative recombination initiation defects 3 [Quercus robur]|uniref:putative recombination initiation defects 3 n=1 Tax=Quercus robur TaxID=38942 RepID=UPI0021623466|nr:putative recombination initiation defects 3 [Quercus robur]
MYTRLSLVFQSLQRFGSQEPENSVKKISCLPQPSCTQEESQMQISRSSSNLMRKWNSASVTDHRSQISEELEHRIGLMETSLNRFGMILDSVQSDGMQLNKGMKEVSLEMDSIRRKLIVRDNFLQSVVKPSDVMFEIWFLLTRLRYGKPEQGT